MASTEPLAKQAARLCFWAPLVAILMNLLSFLQGPAGRSLVGCVSLVFVIVAPVAGIIALIGIRKHGARGILARTLIGMTLSAILITAMAFVYGQASRGRMPSTRDLALASQMSGIWESRTGEGPDEQVTWLMLSADRTYEYRMTGDTVAQFSGTWSVQNKRLYLLVNKFVKGNRKAIGDKFITPIESLEGDHLLMGGTTYKKLDSAEGKTLEDMENEYQAQKMGISVYPTWIGSVDVAGSRIVVVSHDDRSALHDILKGHQTEPVSLLQIVVDNSAGTAAIVIAPDSVRLRNADQVLAAALSPSDILADDNSDEVKWLRQGSAQRSIPAGQKMMEGLVFIPRSFAMSDVSHVTLTVNGTETPVPGNWLTPQEFMEMYQQGRNLRAAKPQ